MKRSALPALLALSLATGCSTDINLPETTAWEGTLISLDVTNPLRGSIAALSRGATTRASIQITNAEPAARYAWRIRSGSCDSPGERVGGLAAYPDLTASATGSASDEAILSETLRPDGAYHAVVLEVPDSDRIIACGNLERQTF